jgi:hypothetical protein
MAHPLRVQVPVSRFYPLGWLALTELAGFDMGRGQTDAHV